MRERGQRGQREPGGVQLCREVREPHACRDGRRARVRIDPHLGRHRVEDEEVAVGVGDPVERVPGAEHTCRPRRGDDLPHLVERGRMVAPGRAEQDVASPVADLFAHRAHRSGSPNVLGNIADHRVTERARMSTPGQIHCAGWLTRGGLAESSGWFGRRSSVTFAAARSCTPKPISLHTVICSSAERPGVCPLMSSPSSIGATFGRTPARCAYARSPYRAVRSAAVHGHQVGACETAGSEFGLARVVGADGGHMRARRQPVGLDQRLRAAVAVIKMSTPAQASRTVGTRIMPLAPMPVRARVRRTSCPL